MITKIDDFIKRVESTAEEDFFTPRTFYHLSSSMFHEMCELLKEQEPVKPKYNARTNWFECGSCHYSMTSGMHCKSELIPAYKVGFCAKCGRSVKWD